jgi:hypothetical protein
MAVHLYGVLDAGAEPAPSIPGLDGRPVRALSLGVRCAWISDVPESRLEATPERIRAHDAVLRGAIANGHSVVPSLFGRLHADDAALVAELQGGTAALDAAMALVRERVEMSFIVATSGAEPIAEPDLQRETRGPGHAHLQHIRNRIHAERILRESAANLALSATRALTDLYIAERVVDDPTPPVLVARAHLVARDSVARYLRAVKLEAANADPALRVAVRGPGAAYSFAAVQIG